jgi:hypothetical protein
MRIMRGRRGEKVKGRIVVVILLLFLGIEVSFGQESKLLFTDSRFDSEWWYPLIEKHNIDASQFTFWSNIKPAKGDTKGYTALELGTGASISDTLLTINDPVFIIRDNDKGYTLITAKTATHNLKISRIDWKNGRMQYFKTKPDEAEPVQSMSFEDLSYETRTKKMVAKKVKGLEPI